MKVLKCFLFGAAVLGVCVLMHFYGEATAAKEMQEDIAKEVIRLHVVANSDLEMDQKLGSLTLCLPLDFHNPLHHSPLRLIFLSNFYFFSVLFCTFVV